MKVRLGPQTPRALTALSLPLLFDGGALILSSLVASALGFAYWIMAARIFPANDVGLASAAVSVLNLLTSLSPCGLDHLAGRFLPVAGPTRPRLTGAIQAAALLFGAIGGSVFWAGSSLWAPALAGAGPLIASGAAAVTLFTVQDQVMVGLLRAHWVPLKNGLFGLAKLILLALAARAMSPGDWSTVLLSWIVPAAAGCCVCSFAAQISASRSRPAAGGSALPAVPALLRFALANYAGMTLLRLPPLVFPLIVLRYTGAAATAYFYSTWMIVNMLLVVSSSLAAAMVARSAGAEHGSSNLARAGFGYALILLLPAALLVMAGGPLVLGLFGPGYSSSYGLLVALTIGALIYPANVFYAGMMRVRCRLKPVVLQGLVVATISMATAVPLTIQYGLIGPGIAFAIGQCAGGCWILFDRKSPFDVQAYTLVL